MRSRYAIAVLFMLFVVFLPLVPSRVSGQGASASRISEAIDNSKLAVLEGNVHPLARREFDRGAAPASLGMEHMLLVLQRSANQQIALETLLAQQQNRSSSNYHKWLTPEQFGQQFGASQQDIQKITSWLESQGFQVNEVAKGRTTIDFSGTAGQVQQAFHTAIHQYVLANGEQHWANASDPQIPAALLPVVAGVHSLNNFRRKRMSHDLGAFRRSADGKITPVNPQFTFAGGCNGTGTNCYAVGPADFAKIYNVPTSVTGSGETIAIVSDSDINASDVSAFRSIFALPAVNFQQIETGTDPGIIRCPSGNECEAVLDVEWAGAVATGANIDLVVSPSTSATFGGDTSAQYIVNNNLAGVLSYSYGACELAIGTSGNSFYQTLWSQAASQGITVVVSTGDNGAAGCESPDPNNTSSAQPATTGLAVNGVASTAFDVAVGGTDFNDVFNPTTYWGSVNSSGALSAMSYIPEVAYNDSCTNPIFASSGFAGFEGLSSNSEANCNDSQAVDFEGAENLIASFGGGGGASNCTTNATTSTTLGAVSSCSGGYAKPSWQSGPGVPNDGKRDIPDVSLFSGDGTLQNFYIMCEADADPDGTTNSCNLNPPFGEFEGVGGTSVAAQAFAGIAALIEQQGGGRQGNANPMLYALAAEQTTANCNSTSSPASTCVFYDTTSGTIAMPCAKGSPNCTVNNSSDSVGILTGFSAGTGYDLATGLGSLNVGNLISKVGANFYLSSSNPVVTISSAGASGNMSVTAYPLNGFTGTVNLSCTGLPTGATCSFSPSSVALTSSTSPTSGIAVTVTVNTTTSSMIAPAFRPQAPRPWIILAATSLASGVFLLALLVGSRPNQRQWSAALAVVALALLITTVACGGGSSSSSSGSGGGTGGPTGSTAATLVGTSASGSPAYSMPFTVTIQ